MTYNSIKSPKKTAPEFMELFIASHNPYNTIQYKQYNRMQYNSCNIFVIQYIYSCDSIVSSGNFRERVTEMCVSI